MASAQDAITGALDELDKARKLVQRSKTRQVRSGEERQFLKALAGSWFYARRPLIVHEADEPAVEAVDISYRQILDSTDREASRSGYIASMKAGKTALIALRGSMLSGKAAAASTDAPPDFTTLASDTTMQAILVRRWGECTRCITGEAYLAATVMMGGLLEALLVARANRLADKSVLFKMKSTPIDPKTKKPLDLRQWMLGSYIDVAHELGWLTKSAKDVAVVLRDYRNYVHPEKERSHGIVLTGEDARMFWEVTKSFSRQLLSSAQ